MHRRQGARQIPSLVVEEARVGIDFPGALLAADAIEVLVMAIQLGQQRVDARHVGRQRVPENIEYIDELPHTAGFADDLHDDAGVIPSLTVPGLLSASVLTASTDARANGGHAESSVAQATIGGTVLPAGFPLITAEVLSSEADVTCKNGKPVFSSAGTVARVTVGGVEIEIPDNGAPVTVPVAGIATLYLNRVVTTPDSITRRALQLTVPSLGIDVVIAESIADVHGKPCQKKKPPKPECSDGKDNDGDKKIDKWDPDCWGPKGYNPHDNSEKH